jgi:hypothetical protein
VSVSVLPLSHFQKPKSEDFEKQPLFSVVTKQEEDDDDVCWYGSRHLIVQGVP